MADLEMLDGDFRRIMGDNKSGSSAIAENVSSFFTRYSLVSTVKMKVLAHKLYSHFSGMGLVRNVIREFLSAMENGDSTDSLAPELWKKIRDQSEKSLKNLAPVFSREVTLATISRSSQVEDAIRKYRDKIEHVYVLESRPMQEGTSLHTSLVAEGINATLLTDSSMNIASSLADISLVGCDSLLPDGTLIHKMGTFPLFALMHFHSKKNYALGIGMKKEAGFSMENYPPFEDHGCRELGITGGNCRNLYFEMIPSYLLDRFCDESGPVENPWP